MDNEAHAFGMQCPSNRRADAVGAAGYEGHFALQ